MVTVVAWAAVATFALVATGSALLGRSTFVATDLLTTVAPWAGAGLGDGTVGNAWPADTVDVVTPKLVLLTEALRSGDVPWWNPFVAGGSPLAALPDTGLGNPLAWPWLLLPASYAPGVVKLLEIAVAVAGTALLLRRLGLSSAAQAVGGLAFVTSGFMIAWTGWPQTRVAALIPLLFWAVDRAICLRRPRDAVPVALVLAAALLGGFPAIVGYAAYALVPYAVVRLAAAHLPLAAWLRAVAVAAGGALLGFGLAAWQLVPFAVNAASAIDFEGRAQDSGSHLDWSALVTALVPGALGDVTDPVWVDHNPVERFSYAGAAVLVLACLTLVVRTRRPAVSAILAYAAGGAAACLALVYGGVLLGVVQAAPVFDTNFVGRLRVLLGFFVAVCAAFGLHALESRTPSALTPRADLPGRARGRVAVALRSGAVALVAVGAVLLVREALLLAPHEFLDQVRTGTVVALAVALGCVAVVVAARWSPRRTWAVVASVLLPVVVAGQALLVVGTWWPRSDPDTFYPATATHDYLDGHLGADRYASTGLTMMPGTSSLYRQRAATGHAFHTEQWRELLEAVDPAAMRSSTFSVLTLADAASPVLDRMAVAYLVADPSEALPGEVGISSEMAGTASLEPGASLSAAPVASLTDAGGLRGVRVDLAEGFDTGSAPDGTLTVSAVDAGGTVVATTAATVPGTADPVSVWVPLAFGDLAASADLVLEVAASGGRAPSLPVDAQGRWIANTVRADDGLTVVHTGDATIYARTTSLSRIRWATGSVVVPDPERRVELLASGDLDPGTVVLSREQDAPTAGAPATGGTGTAALDIREDGFRRITVAVDAPADGMLVVADARRDGWSVQVDGRPASLVEADHAMSAVAVTAGQHTVELVYSPPGLRSGTALTAAALAVAAALSSAAVAGSVRRRRARLTQDSQDQRHM